MNKVTIEPIKRTVTIEVIRVASEYTYISPIMPHEEGVERV